MPKFDQVKQCPKCNQWFTINDLIVNPAIELIGMKACEFDPELNLYYFYHNTSSCRTTFMIPVEQVESFITHHFTRNLRAGTSNCEMHCLDLFDKNLCGQKCRNAPYREFLNNMIEKKKIITKPVT